MGQREHRMEQYLEAGKIVTTHGIRGDVKAESWCDSPAVLRGLATVYFRRGDTYEPHRVQKASVLGGMVLLHLEGVDTVEGAAVLRNRVLYADRADLPKEEGSHFIADLIGLPVYRTADGQRLGVLSDIRTVGGRELYEIKTDGETVLLPTAGPFIDRISEEDGIYVTPIGGMFPNADGEA